MENKLKCKDNTKINFCPKQSGYCCIFCEDRCYVFGKDCVGDKLYMVCKFVREFFIPYVSIPE